MIITLKLEEQEAQTVLNALAQRPYVEVANVIAKIMAQASDSAPTVVPDEDAEGAPEHSETEIAPGSEGVAAKEKGRGRRKNA